MTKEELIKEYMSDSTPYCCYCGTSWHKQSCCGENHFETFAEMSEENQLNILDYDDRLQTLP